MPHQRLITKLKAHGIGDTVANWVKGWLTDREQRVTIKGKQSLWLPVKSGVPQGSVLGPTLFVGYINDIDDNICSHILKFADDTKIFGPVATEEQISMLQQDLVQVFRWSQEWQMLFNETKCKCLHIGHRNQHHVYVPSETTTLKRLSRKEIWEW